MMSKYVSQLEVSFQRKQFDNLDRGRAGSFGKLLFLLLLNLQVLCTSGSVQFLGPSGTTGVTPLATSYIPVPVTTTLTDFTITFWIKTYDVGGSGIWWHAGKGLVDGEVSESVNDFGVSLIGGKIAFGVGNPDTTLFSIKSINDGAWHHVGAMRSGSILTIYIDGVVDASLSSAPTGARNAITQLTIGTINGRYRGSLDGFMNEVRIYNQASAAYITDSRERKTSDLPSSLVNYYPLDNDALDYSGNDRDGTVTNVLWKDTCTPLQLDCNGECNADGTSGSVSNVAKITFTLNGGDGYLTIAEVLALTSSGKNAALASNGATASASSTISGTYSDAYLIANGGPISSWIAAGAIDGNINSIYHSDGGDSSPTLTVTFSSPQTIVQVGLLPWMTPHACSTGCFSRTSSTVRLYDSGNNLLQTYSMPAASSATWVYTGTSPAATVTTGFCYGVCGVGVPRSSEDCCGAGVVKNSDGVCGAPNPTGESQPSGEPTSEPTAYLNVRTCSADHYGLNTIHTEWDYDEDATNTLSGESLGATSVNPDFFLWATYFHDNVRHRNVLYTGGLKSTISIKNAHTASSFNMYSVDDVTGNYVVPSEGVHTVDISAPCGRCPKPKPKPKPVPADSSNVLNGTETKPPPPPVTTPYHFSLNGVESTGIVKACGLPFLASLVYPRYSIVAADGKEILAGPLCGNEIEKTCEVVLPLKGQHVFKVLGFTSEEDASKFQWNFCGLSGSVGSIMTFEMDGPECKVISINTDTQAYAHVDDYFNWIKASSEVAISSSSDYSPSLLVVMLVVVLTVSGFFVYRRSFSAAEIDLPSSEPSSHCLISDENVELESALEMPEKRQKTHL